MSYGETLIEENNQSIKSIIWKQRAANCLCPGACLCFENADLEMTESRWKRFKERIGRWFKSGDDDDSGPDVRISYDESRGWSFFNFTWMSQWVRIVAKGRLDAADFPKQPIADFDQLSVAEFGLLLHKYRDPNYSTIWDKWFGKIRVCIVRVFRYSFLWLIIYTLIRDILDVSNAYLLTFIMRQRSLTNFTDVVGYIFICIGIWLTQLVQLHLDAHQHFYYKRLSTKAESMILSYLFGRIITKGEDYITDLKHSLQPTSTSEDNTSLLNLALFDAFEISWGVMKIVDFIAIPLKIIIVGGWLYSLVGFNAITALVLVFFLGILMSMSEYRSAKLASNYIKKMDDRVVKTQMVLEELQAYRLLRWVPDAYKSIMDSRMQEMRLCQKRIYLASIGHWIGTSLPAIAALFLFINGVLNGDSFIKGLTMDPTVAIPLLHTLTFFIKPFKELPADISDHLETTVSCNRLESFLFSKKLNSHISTIYDKSSSSRVIINSKDTNGNNFTIQQHSWTKSLSHSVSRHLPLWIQRFPRMGTKSTTQNSDDSMAVGLDAEHWSFLSSGSLKCALDPCPTIVEFTNASFMYKTRQNLQGINFKLERGNLAIITGPGDSGKTSFLEAILGELHMESGEIYNKPLQMDLPIGYVAQNPWVPVGTAQECILFGHDMDPDLYKTVVDAVELGPDIKSWKEGDYKMIDEGGQCISTGQKARLSMARVLYNQMHTVDPTCALYCFDDVFSVLDPGLVLRIFQTFFGPNGLLKDGATVVVLPQSLIDLIGYCDFGSLKVQVHQLFNLEQASCSFDISNYCNGIDTNQTIPQDLQSKFTTDDHGTCRIQHVTRVGYIKPRNYFWFIRKVGLKMALLVMLLLLIAMLLDVSADIIINWWSSIENIHIPESITSSIGHVIYTSNGRLKLNYLYMYTFVISIALVIYLYMCMLETFCTVRSATKVYESAISGVLNATVDNFNKKSIGSINNRLSMDQSYVDTSVFYSLSRAVTTICFGLIIGTTLLVLSVWLLPIMPFLGLVIYFVVYRHYMPMCRENMRATLESRAALVTMVNLSISGSKEIRASQRQTYAMSRFLSFLDVHQKTKFFANAASSWTMIRLKLCLYPLIAINMMVPVMTFFQSCYHGNSNVDGSKRAITASVGLALSYSYRFAKILKTILTYVVELETLMCASQRLQDLAEMNPAYNMTDQHLFKPRKQEHPSHGKRINVANVPRTGLILKNLCVSYNTGEDTQVLFEDLNLECGPRDHVGVVGRTGAGKSSLLHVLSGIIKSDGGLVQLDGIDIGLAAEANMTEAIPHSPPLLSQWTIRHLVDSRGTFTDKEIWDALEKCTIADFIRSFPIRANPLDVILTKSSLMNDQGAIVTNAQMQYIILAKIMLNLGSVRLVLVDEPHNILPNEYGIEPLCVILRRHFTSCIVFIVTHDAKDLGVPEFKMSYGWLTESTLVPRKPKPISVPKKSFNVLQNLINKRKDPAETCRRREDPFLRKNPKVQERNLKDKARKVASGDLVRERLLEKERLYNKLGGNISILKNTLASGDLKSNECLVDFQKLQEIKDACCTIEQGSQILLQAGNPNISTTPQAAPALEVNVESLDNVERHCRDLENWFLKMVKGRLLLENIEHGTPATWHRNTLSNFASGRADYEGIRNKMPTQLVYPNDSFNIGVVVESLNGINGQSRSESSNGNESNHPVVVVYASTKPVAGNGNLALTPAQILLPQTSFYTVTNSKDPLQISVQVLLRVEPRVCTTWEVQNTNLLSLVSSKDRQDRQASIGNFPEFGDACSTMVWVASIPSINAAVSDLVRTWVFAYDAFTKSRAGAEVIISRMHSIQFETRNRRIAVNQIATLRITSQDKLNNTFTSLEGIPFEAKIEDSKIMQIIDLRNDPEVATLPRLQLLEKRNSFSVSRGFTLTSDVIVLQGKMVGKTKITLRVLLPEYSHIVLNNVEFTVSDSVFLVPSMLVLPPATDFSFCLQRLESSGIDPVDGAINKKNYTWSCDGKTGQVARSDGSFHSGKVSDAGFKVILKDKRNDETFTSDVVVKEPTFMGLSFGNVNEMLHCLGSNGISFLSQNADGNIVKKLEELYKSMYASCLGDSKCGKQLAHDKEKQMTSISMGVLYLWDVTLFTRDGLHIYVTENIKFTWNVPENSNLKIHWKSPNGRFILLEAVKTGTQKIAIECTSHKKADGKLLRVDLTLSISHPVTIDGFVPTMEAASTDFNKNVSHVHPKPLLIPPNETVQLRAQGGSGDYEWHVIDENICTVDKGVLQSKNIGSTVLTLVDKHNIENQFKVKVMVDMIDRVQFANSNMQVENGGSIAVEILAFPPPRQGQNQSQPHQFYVCPSFTKSRQVKDSGGPSIDFDDHLHLTRTIEKPFTCVVYIFEAVTPGETKLKFCAKSLDNRDVTDFARVEIYTRLSTSIDLHNGFFPLKSAPSPFRNIPKEHSDSKVFANVPIGGVVRLVTLGGPPGDDVTMHPCSQSNNILVEKVSNDTNNVFDVYCLGAVDSELVCVSINGTVRSQVTIGCKVPHKLEIIPLAVVNNRSGHDNLQNAETIAHEYKIGNDTPPGLFISGVGALQLEKQKCTARITYNDYHAFMAVAFDEKGTAILPSHNYKVGWYGSATKLAQKFETCELGSVNNGIFILKAPLGPNVDLIANLEWADAFDTIHCSPKFTSAIKSRTITNALLATKQWKKSDNRRGSYAIGDALNLIPTIPHDILVGVYNPESNNTTDGWANMGLVNVSIYFTPKLKYQMAVILGSGNYVEIPSYPQLGNLQHGQNFTFESDFSNAAYAGEGTLNLFDFRIVTRRLDFVEKTLRKFPARLISFSCTTPCSRALEIMDKSLLGQVTKRLVLRQAPVAKLAVVVSDISQENFEDFGEMSLWKPSLNLLGINRLYKVYAVGLDPNDVPMSYPSLQGVKFTVNGPANSYILSSPKDHNFSMIGHAQIVQFFAEGTFTISAEIQNITPDGTMDTSSISDSVNIVVYKESKPILQSMVLLPNSPELQFQYIENSLSRSNLLAITMTSTKDTVLEVTRTSNVGYFQSHNCGTCVLNCQTSSSASGQTTATTQYKVNVTVALPYAITINVGASSDIFTRTTVPLVAIISDKQGNVFTPLYLAGVPETIDKSSCHYYWSLEGNGVFLNDGDQGIYGVGSKECDGVGMLRTVLQVRGAGPLKIHVKAVCKNTTSGTITLKSSKVNINGVSLERIFHNEPPHSKLILATRTSYNTKLPIAEVMNTTNQEIIQASSKNTLVTKAHVGDALLKLQDGSVEHAFVSNVERLHIVYGSDDQNQTNSNGTQFRVLLKTKMGQEVCPPSNMRLKVFLSNPALYKVQVNGPNVVLVPNFTTGCSTVLVQLDSVGKDETFDNGSMWDLMRSCLVNVLVPQDSRVIQGSSVRFLGGTTRTFTFGLNAIPLLDSFAPQDKCSSLKCFQNALTQSMPRLLLGLERELSGAILNCLNDYGADKDLGMDLNVRIYPPVLEVVSKSCIVKAMYIFVFRVGSLGSLDPVAFATTLTQQLVTNSTNNDDLFSMLETAISPVFDSGGSWNSSANSYASVLEGQVNAIKPTDVEITFEKNNKRGTAKLSVLDTIDKVEVLHSCTINGTNILGTRLPPPECSPNAHVVFRAYSNTTMIKSSVLIDTKLFPNCDLSSTSADWVSKLFISHPLQYPIGNAEFLTACRIDIKTFNNQSEWLKFVKELKRATAPIPSKLKLKVALHSTSTRDDAIKYGTLAIQRTLTTINRIVSKELWSQELDYPVPMHGVFVNDRGTRIQHVNPSGPEQTVVFYPFYKGAKVISDTRHYTVKVIQIEGLYCSFTILSDGIGTSGNVTVVYKKHTLATLLVSPQIKTSTQQYRYMDYQSSFRYLDIVQSIVTCIIAVGSGYLLYLFWNRQHKKYYDAAEPIKIERKMPTIFQNIYETDYIGNSRGAALKQSELIDRLEQLESLPQGAESHYDILADFYIQTIAANRRHTPVSIQQEHENRPVEPRATDLGQSDIQDHRNLEDLKEQNRHLAEYLEQLNTSIDPVPTEIDKTFSKMYLDGNQKWPSTGRMLSGASSEVIKQLDARDELCKNIIAVQHCKILSMSRNCNKSQMCTSEPKTYIPREAPSDRGDLISQINSLEREIDLYRNLYQNS
ncbi:bifunctional ABC transporter-like [Babesia duncani]|uniref:Bifunctional ABC transporter-like n=1 Tax=Babesia duncani TaxID=323732 RepID=A0AAD9UQ35_9APIC|nr:bifunctional ABC transporter-like [Babesia duncani]